MQIKTQICLEYIRINCLLPLAACVYCWFSSPLIQQMAPLIQPVTQVRLERVYDPDSGKNTAPGRQEKSCRPCFMFLHLKYA